MQSPVPWRLRPADRRPLLRRERLGDQHVVVDRHHVAADRPHQRREAVGGQHDPAGAQAGRRRRSAPRRPACRASDVTGLCSWIRTPSSDAARARPQASRAGSTIALPVRCQRPAMYVGESSSRRTAAWSRYSASIPRSRSSSAKLGQLLRLVRLAGGEQEAGLLVGGVDREPLQRLLDARQVLEPQPLQLVDLVGEARQAVRQPMGQRRVDEPAVAAAASEGDGVALEQHDVAGRDRPAWPGSRPTAR